jgi:hypothetical protein
MGLELEIRVGFALTTSQWDINVNLRRHVPPLEHPLQALEASRYPVDLSALGAQQRHWRSEASRHR